MGTALGASDNISKPVGAGNPDVVLPLYYSGVAEISMYRSSASQSGYLHKDDFASFATTTYVDTAIAAAVVGLWDDRGNWDPTSRTAPNNYPNSNGSGTAGAVLKGDCYTISVAGILGTTTVGIGDVVRALRDAPGDTAAYWDIIEGGGAYLPLAGGVMTGAYSSSNTTNAVNTSSGSWYTAGGIGVAKDGYFGGAVLINRSVAVSSSGNSGALQAVLTTTGSSANTAMAFNKFQITHTATANATNASGGLSAVYASINVTASTGTTTMSNSVYTELILASAAAVVTRHGHVHVSDAQVSGGGSVGTQIGLLVDKLSSATNNYILSAYNTTDQTTNYERLRISWNSNVANIVSEAGGSGVQRAILISGSALTFTGSSTFTNKISSYNGDTTAGANGIATVVATASSLANTGSIGSTVLFAVATSGMYRMTVYINTSTTQAGITISATAVYTDDVGVQTRIFSSNAVTGAITDNRVSMASHTNSADLMSVNHTFYATAATNISYLTTVTGAIVGGRYGCYVVLERLT